MTQWGVRDGDSIYLSGESRCVSGRGYSSCAETTTWGQTQGPHQPISDLCGCGKGNQRTHFASDWWRLHIRIACKANGIFKCVPPSNHDSPLHAVCIDGFCRYQLIMSCIIAHIDMVIQSQHCIKTLLQCQGTGAIAYAMVWGGGVWRTTVVLFTSWKGYLAPVWPQLSLIFSCENR